VNNKDPLAIGVQKKKMKMKPIRGITCGLTEPWGCRPPKKNEKRRQTFYIFIDNE